MAQSFFTGQVVDTPAAREFTSKALERISGPELEAIAGLVELKAAAFRHALEPLAESDLDSDRSLQLLRSVFAARRRAGVFLEALSPQAFSTLVRSLLWGREPASTRVGRFHEAIVAVDGVPENTGYDLASEILHFYDPERYWLWTRWMWDPRTETGALPLVLTEDVDLTGADIAETYDRVGVAVAFINDVGEAAGFRERGHGVFDTDVYLATVYAVYMYTTLRMRMTQEFNKVVPDLDEMLRRLLGVRDSPLMVGASE